jgi:transcriptional regulator with XRE-family HTH domain
MFDLRSIRKQKGMTLKALASMTDLSESYISLIENMERRPSVDAAKRIAEVLEFHWTRFFDK